MCMCVCVVCVCVLCVYVCVCMLYECVCLFVCFCKKERGGIYGRDSVYVYVCLWGRAFVVGSFVLSLHVKALCGRVACMYVVCFSMEHTHTHKHTHTHRERERERE